MPDRIRTLIIDDEPVARRRLQSLLVLESDIEIVGEAGSGTAAVEEILKQKPDLVFLDIQMPGLDGFEVLREIGGRHRPFIVFVTAHDEHAIRAFDFEAVDYVLKPVVERRFRDAVRKVVARIRTDSPDDLAQRMASLLERVAPMPAAARLAIRHDGRITFVRHEDIDWVEANGDLLTIHAGRERHTMRETMTELASKLPSPRFTRVHRSIIVNTDRIREVQPWFKGDYVIILHDGTKLRSGRSYRETIQSLLS